MFTVRPQAVGFLPFLNRHFGLIGEPESEEERDLLKRYLELLESQKKIRAKRKAAQQDLDAKIDAKYPKLTEAEIKKLVVEDKWLDTLSNAAQGEIHDASHQLTSRLRQLAER
jgi:type I restriction enzyme M protein